MKKQKQPLKKPQKQQQKVQKAQKQQVQQNKPQETQPKKQQVQQNKAQEAQLKRQQVQKNKAQEVQLKRQQVQQNKTQEVQQQKRQIQHSKAQEAQPQKQQIQQDKLQKAPQKPQEYNKLAKQQRQKRDWKAYIYNSPYLILIALTSLAVMFTSDEIGISAAAREAQMLVCKSYAKMPEEQEMVSADSQGLIQEDRVDIVEQLPELSTDNSSEQEAHNQDADSEAKSGAEMENAGERREESDDLQNDDRLQDEHDDPETGIETAEIPEGVTNYEFYEPLQTESRYYKDAGKVALTTEYPYTKENTGYFDDAAFLGDSRTLGISDYAGLETADFYCDSGMMIFKILEDDVTYQKTGSKVKMAEVLQNKDYGKIYIMLGMNELGYGDTEMYLDQYRQVLQQIREWQPKAIIYIMANLHVSREKNNMETEFNNININAKNAASASLANGTDVFYLDVNPVFTDEEGYLKSELTFDGVHLYAKHYDAWREFLLEHAVAQQ